MTHPSDFIMLNTFMFGPMNVPLNQTGFDWPPPLRIVIDTDDGKLLREATAEDDPSIVFKRTRYSDWAFDVVAGSDHLARGAEYKYEHDV